MPIVCGIRDVLDSPATTSRRSRKLTPAMKKWLIIPDHRDEAKFTVNRRFESVSSSSYNAPDAVAAQWVCRPLHPARSIR